MNLPPKSLTRFKQEAKSLAKSDGVKLTLAQEVLARKYSFPNWKALLRACEAASIQHRPTPAPPLKFISNEDVSLDSADLQLLSQERKEDLPIDLKIRVAKGQEVLSSLGIEHSLFEPTKTGLKKHILDATSPVRMHLEMEGFHDYRAQVQGGKVIKDACFLSPESAIDTKVSLYRPITKKGDPRMWFSGLPSYAEATDQIAIIVMGDKLYLINLSKFDLNELSGATTIELFFKAYQSVKNEVPQRLLKKLREIAKFPIRSSVKGDTAVGVAVESALGISANCKKTPDYYGIEIKSGRGSKNRSTLFAQVADWTLSPLKSSAEILDAYGYPRGEDFRLYCTISTQQPNSRGLKFVYDESKGYLIERDVDENDVAVWTERQLVSRLLEKHAETFWIEAKSLEIDGQEWFELCSVTHTKKPLTTQLIPLIQSGVITMDHLIKRKSGAKVSVSEKGPLFKINKRDLKFLFPEPVVYSLKD